MPRVAGADPGTSSLDWLILEDGAVGEQVRFAPDELRANPALPVEWLTARGPFDLIAGPSGYGLPLVRSRDCTDRERDLMALVRPDEHGRDSGILHFTALLRALCASALPVVFLPGVIHLPTVPTYRKTNRIDLGTADKLCVAALALERCAPLRDFCLVELGSAFTACVVVRDGQIVDGLGGTSGPVGWRSSGAWDGEAAYLLSSLTKNDLFTGGVLSLADREEGKILFRESLLKAVAGLKAVTPFAQVVLSGRLLETEPEFCATVEADLTRVGTVLRLESLPGAWVKHAAQGAALLADGLAGGACAPLVCQLALTGAAGSVLDWLTFLKIHHKDTKNTKKGISS